MMDIFTMVEVNFLSFPEWQVGTVYLRTSLSIWLQMSCI